MIIYVRLYLNRLEKMSNMKTSYKTLHIEMFTIYTVYLYNLFIWAIVMFF